MGTMEKHRADNVSKLEERTTRPCTRKGGVHIDWSIIYFFLNISENNLKNYF